MLSKQIKISKEKILQVAFDITKEKGIEYVSNREIAKYLSSSIRPIYYQFKNSSELISELYKKIEKYFCDYVTNNLNDTIPKYKQTGINYIKFAKNEKNLFKVLFMSKIKSKDDSFNIIKEYAMDSTKLSKKDIDTFHNMMWIYTHGIACLIASEKIILTDEEISNLLTKEFNVLMKGIKDGECN